jgi:biotin operon repressor
MTDLFYQLLTTPKIKRWILLLDQLEDTYITGNQLAKLLDCTRRTVINDVKEIKRGFNEAIFLLGDENGYLLELQDPRLYYQKKQELLEGERLFQMVDTLFEDQRRTNHEWAAQLQLSPATFARTKRQLNAILDTKYGITLSPATNEIIGKETRIRQFFYEFYFTLPLYPKALAQKVRQMHDQEPIRPSSKWQLKQTPLQGWTTITCKRIKQGHVLIQEGADQELCQKLALALDPSCRLDLPAQDKACLFLAALEEQQFFRPVVQTEFIYHFSPSHWGTLIEATETERHGLLVQTLIHLMKEFFHLPYELDDGINDEGETSLAEEKLFEQLSALILKEKQKLDQSISVSFRLIGPKVLQEWIKKEVRKQLEINGYWLFEGELSAQGGVMPRIQITNHPNLHPTTICLQMIPDEEEIKEKIEMYKLG